MRSINGCSSSSDRRGGGRLTHPGGFVFGIVLALTIVVILIVSVFPSCCIFVINYTLNVLIGCHNGGLRGSVVGDRTSTNLDVTSAVLYTNIFLNILDGDNVVRGVTVVVTDIVPTSLNHFLPIVVNILDIPLTLLFSASSCFCNLLPILVDINGRFNIGPTRVTVTVIIYHGYTAFVDPITPTACLNVNLTNIRVGSRVGCYFN